MINRPAAELIYTEICVVMPAYRSEGTIAEAIESVLTQNVHDVVVAVSLRVDDTATIDTVKSLADNRVRIFYQTGRGISNARNIVLQSVFADAFLFLDSDDTLNPGAIAAYRQAMEAEPAAGLFYGNWTAVVASGARLVEYHQVPYFTKSTQRLRRSIALDNLVATSGTILRGYVVREVGFFNEAYNHGEDWEYWMRVLQKAPFQKVKFDVARYRHTKLAMIKSRSFWMVEARIIDAAAGPKYNRFLAKLMVSGRYGIYYLRTLKSRRGSELTDLTLGDLMLAVPAILFKIWRRYAYRLFGDQGFAPCL